MGLSRPALAAAGPALRLGRAVNLGFDGEETLMSPIRGRKECTQIPQQAQISVTDRWKASAWHDRALKLQQELKGVRSQLAAEHKAGRETADCFAVACIGHLGAMRQDANRTCDTTKDMQKTRVALAGIVPHRHKAFFADWAGACWGVGACRLLTKLQQLIQPSPSLHPMHPLVHTCHVQVLSRWLRAMICRG